MPHGDEIRVHEHYGGESAPASLRPDLALLAETAIVAAGTFTGRPLDYARVDLLQYADGWAVSELELIEPGLYLDVLPAMAGPFTDLVTTRT